MEAVMGLENIQNQLRKNCWFSSFATDNCSCWLVLVFFSHLEAFIWAKSLTMLVLKARGKKKKIKENNFFIFDLI